MKKLTILFILILSTFLVYSQQTRDIVHLKNGSIIKGQVMEYDQTEGGRIKIQTTDGSTLVYPAAEVVKMMKETVRSNTPVKIFGRGTQDVNLDNYGGQLSFGPAIGGGGLIGLPVQYRPTQLTALEIGLYYRPVVVFDLYNDEAHFKGGAAIAGGGILYLDRKHKSFKQKVKLNGVSLKAGHSFGDFSQSFAGLAWANESFREDRPLKSFLFELGLGVVSSNFSTFEFEEPGSQPFVYFKLNWASHKRLD